MYTQQERLFTEPPDERAEQLLAGLEAVTLVAAKSVVATGSVVAATVKAGSWAAVGWTALGLLAGLDPIPKP
jgi:translation elongation factor EF-Tu-like GTPase